MGKIGGCCGAGDPGRSGPAGCLADVVLVLVLVLARVLALAALWVRGVHLTQVQQVVRHCRGQGRGGR